MIWLLGGIIIAATLAFIGLWFGLLWLYDRLRDRYQSRRKHVLHTTAADERVVTGEQESMARLRALPAPGKDYISDRNVVLPWTPTWEQAASHQLPLTYPRFEQQALEGDLAARQGERQLPHRLAALEPMDPGDVVEPADVDADVADWQHILAPDADPWKYDATPPCHCGQPAGHLAAALAGDHPETALDTSQFEAIR